jgi:pyridoxamine 5'-phosphate oxidase
VDQPYDDKNLAVGQKVEDLEDSVARANFRVVIIKPEEMESVDLSDPTKARRQVYKFDESSGQWTHTECWP